MAKYSAKELEAIRKENREFFEEHFPGPYQPKIMTMAPKVAVEVAMPGWQPKEWYEGRGIHNLPPISFQEQADAIVACVKAGAAVVHTHPRDPETGVMPKPIKDPVLLKRHAECLEEVMDRAHDKVDFVTAHHTWCRDPKKNNEMDYITDTEHLLNDGVKKGIGNFYVQACLIMTSGRPTIAPMEEGVKWFEAHNIKPMFSCESYALDLLKRHFFDNGVAKSKPYWIAMQEGKHNDERVFADPWTALEIITTLGLLNNAVGKNAFIALHPGGRNWLPALNQGLLMGVELVRVGIEDAFFLYPHKDDISHSVTDMVEMVVNLIQALGRDLATPDDVRKRTKIKLTK